jgi:hypothetical protein
MADLFKEIIPSILQTKKYVLDEEKDYKGFLVNRSLSYHMDCILYANQMNMNPSLPPKLQYCYLLHTIRPIKRKFEKWQKSTSIKDLDCVKEYFGYSNEKAKEALKILSDDDLQIIKDKLDKGGVKSQNTK